MELDVNKVQEVKEVVLENLVIMKNVLESKEIEFLKIHQEEDYKELGDKMYGLEREFLEARLKIYKAIDGILNGGYYLKNIWQCENMAMLLNGYTMWLVDLMERITDNTDQGKNNWRTIRRMETAFERFCVGVLDYLDYLIAVLSDRR